MFESSLLQEVTLMIYLMSDMPNLYGNINNSKRNLYVALLLIAA